MTDEIYRGSQLAAISSALAGINRAENQLNATAERLSAGSVGADSAAGIDSVSLSSVAVDLIQARNGVAVNVKVAQAAQETQKSLLNLLG